jgi:hypothetical protein
VLHDMGLREYAAMHRFWGDFPPLAVLAAAWFGIKPKPATTSTPVNQDAQIEQLMAMFGVTPEELLAGSPGVIR